ncbi:hypothetical protein SK128_005019 [Halocaridina rubra]|uniref:Uncharacterized protein n=1 Tax=Halocaridina rubra TaxID=373956 RepID=A0AAN8X5Y6_HALRR
MEFAFLILKVIDVLFYVFIAISCRARKLSLSEPTVTAHSSSSNHDVWTHHIPLRLENGSKKDGIISSSSAFRSGPPAICPAPTTICTTNSTVAQLASVNVYHPIHLLAAVALGEVAVTAVKRMPCVDVGVQTEGELMKRSRRKSSSPGRCDPLGNLSSSVKANKRKRSTETQTRLTHRGSKRRNNAYQEEIAAGIAVGVGPANSAIEVNNSEVGEPRYFEVSTDECINEDNSVGSLTLQIDLPELITTQSTSGTQTSPRGSGFTHTHLHNLALSFFDRACGDDEPTISAPCVTNITSTQTPQDLDPFDESTKLLMGEADDLLGVVEETSSVGHGRHAPSLTHIRSSSIETQTDHDVLLSGNTSNPEDVDDISLTNTETQTYPSSLFGLNANSPYERSNACHTAGPCDVQCNDNFWCTSETQTYEDFSDIEQFMRSTIHTQTSDPSHSELFPELSFTHTQTQTSIDDPPAFVTTHTQTSCVHSLSV